MYSKFYCNDDKIEDKYFGEMKMGIETKEERFVSDVDCNIRRKTRIPHGNSRRSQRQLINTTKYDIFSQYQLK